MARALMVGFQYVRDKLFPGHLGLRVTFNLGLRGRWSASGPSQRSTQRSTSRGWTTRRWTSWRRRA
eukprot:10319081-Alexandrium_andersonii.AAC.1